MNARILVVEDDRSLLEGIGYALSREGFTPFLVSSLKDGRIHLGDHSPDLILLDVMLPDGTGFDLCREIREVSSVPILFLTACDEEVNVVMGLELGGDDYLTKPFRVQELLARIRAILRRSQSQSTMRAGCVVLDSLNHCLHRDGQVIALTPTEFKLCQVLAANPGQILSREQLQDRLWEMDGEFIDDNTISVYIRRLREKIEADPSDPRLILTVRGWGYRWQGGA